MLVIFGEGCKLIKAMQSMYVGAETSIRVNGSIYECSELKMGLKQGFVMLPLLFITFVDGGLHETKARKVGKGTSLNCEGRY